MNTTKIYLEQIAKYVGTLSKKKQSIDLISKYNSFIKYKYANKNNEGTPAIFIHDSDLIIKNVVIDPENENLFTVNGKPIDSKVHVILWDDSSEIGRDYRGIYVDYEGALNGIFCINGNCVTAYQLDQMANIPF